MSLLDEEIYKILTDLVACWFFAHSDAYSKFMIMTGELYQWWVSKLQVEGQKKSPEPVQIRDLIDKAYLMPTQVRRAVPMPGLRW